MTARPVFDRFKAGGQGGPRDLRPVRGDFEREDS
jgi:hypothetical protein